jgi:type III secretion system regulator LcrR
MHPRPHADRFTTWLKAQGHEVTLYQPGGFLGFPPVGWELRLRRATVVYQVDSKAPDTLVVVLFTRAGDRTGLNSPFADFVRLVALAQRAGMARIKGRVEATEDRPDDTLETEPMAAFYRRYLAGVDVVDENGAQWIVGELEGLKLPRKVPEGPLSSDDEPRA